MMVLQRRWGVILLITASALVGTLVGVLLGERNFEARTTLQVPVASAGSVGQDDLDYTDRLVNTYVQIAKSDSFRAEVERSVGGTQLDLSLEPQANTELVDLVAQAPAAATAQRAANTAAAALIKRISEQAESAEIVPRERLERELDQLEQRLTALRGQLDGTVDPTQRIDITEALRAGEVRYQALAQQVASLEVASGTRSTVSVVDPAAVPDSASWTSSVPGMLIGLVFGLLTGVGIAYVLERRAPQLHTLADIEKAAGAPVLATIPMVRGDTSKLFNGAGIEQQSFGRLRALLLPGNRLAAPQTVLVTGLMEGDGTTLVAANLAASVARSRRRTLVVDANLHHPRLHEFFGLDHQRGLRDMLERDERSHARHLVQETGIPNLSLLPSGSASANAGELLASSGLERILEELGGEFDLIVIDSPALATASDAIAVAVQVDAVLLVIGGTPVGNDVVQSARRQLEGVGASGLGLVVNRWRAQSFQANPSEPGDRKKAPATNVEGEE